MKTLFLTGYEGEMVKDFVEKLKKNKIDTVVDIREIPLSRKNGFSKNSLVEVLGNKGIKYYNIPELGSPSGIRKNLHNTGDYISFFKAYRKYIEDDKIEEIDKIISKEKNVVLLCFEKITELCHRAIVANELKKKHPRLKLIPL